MASNAFELDDGDRVVHDVNGKTGTVLNVEFLYEVVCGDGCCSECTGAEVTVMWDGEKEEDWDLAEDLSLLST